MLSYVFQYKFTILLALLIALLSLVPGNSMPGSFLWVTAAASVGEYDDLALRYPLPYDATFQRLHTPDTSLLAY